MNKKKPKRTAALYLREIPRDIRDNFKAVCAKKGRSMTEYVIEFMIKEIENEKRLARKSLSG